jgi:phage gp29-like protein
MSSNAPDKPEEDNIPLLEDVVTPDELDAESELVNLDEDTESVDSQTPEYDKILHDMRDDIVAQLQADLHPLLVQSVEQAIHEAMERAARVMHQELTRPLEQRLLDLIEERMEQEFGPREHPLHSDEGK